VKSTALLTAVRRALGQLGNVSGRTILVGFSGCADSLALLDALWLLSSETGFALAAGHLHHALRPESEEDAAFCRTLCEERGVPFHLGRADVRERARLSGGGLEEAARIERHAFLRAVKAEVGALVIALAHTGDDQAETFLLRLLRGSGRRGLASMRVRDGDLWRPLLELERRDVLTHLRRRGLAWREDPSNRDPAFLRNRVRHELLPYLETHFNPRIRTTLRTSAALLDEEARWLEAEGEALFERLARREGQGVVLSRPQLLAVPRPLARLALRRALCETGGLGKTGFSHVEAVLQLAAARAPSGHRLALPGRREAVVSFDELRIGARIESAPAYASPLPVPGRIELPGGMTLTATHASGPEAIQSEVAVIEAPAGPLVVRTRQPGDRMTRRGRDVSLKRVLREERIPVDLRPSLPLVAVGRRVLWFPWGRGSRVAVGAATHSLSAFRGTLEGGDAVLNPPDPGAGRQPMLPERSGPENEPRFVRLSIERS
jgi:tRNA(Ile)-lysidine synthase